MHYIWLIIIGLIAGSIAKFIIHGSGVGGWIPTILLGIAGSFVGNFLKTLMHIGNPLGETSGLIASTIGAIILLLLYRLFRRVAQPH